MYTIVMLQNRMNITEDMPDGVQKKSRGKQFIHKIVNTIAPKKKRLPVNRLFKKSYLSFFTLNLQF